MNDTAKLTVEISNRQPVELLDLARSMISMGDEYQRFAAAGDQKVDREVRLYVKEIRTGSIITELVAVAPYVLPFVEHADTIVGYAKHLKTLYEWFAGKSEQKPEIVEKATLQNLSEIVEPVVKDHGSQINIGAVNASGNVIVNLNLSFAEANAAQNGVRRELETIKEPVTGLHEQVVMYWAQARNRPDSKAGDRARIDRIYNAAVKVRFANDALKAKMLFDEPHPFAKAFLVDVMVDSVEGKPVLYTVLHSHETLDR